MAEQTPSDVIENTLVDEGSPATFAQLEQFGGMMMSEVRERTATLDAKAQNAIGWSGAIIAVLLSSIDAATIDTVMVLILIGTLAAGAAVLAGTMTLILREWPWPSEDDWFCLELIGNPHKLRAHHLMSQLETHRAHSAENERKAYRLFIAQCALAVAVIALTLALGVNTVQMLAPDAPLAPLALPPPP